MAGFNIRTVAGSLILAGLGTATLAEGLAGSYLAGRQARYTSDFSAGASYYTQALTRDPTNPQIMESVVLAQLSRGRIDLALPIARKMEAESIQSQVAQMAMIADEAKRGDFEALLMRKSAETGVGPLVDGLVHAWAMLGEGDMSGALTAFDMVAEERGLRAFALYHKALALASVGDFEAAEKILSGKSSGPLQMTRRGALARIEGLSQLERNEEGIALIDQLFGKGLDPELRQVRERLEAGELLDFTHVHGPSEGIAEVFYSVAAALSNEDQGEDYTLLYSRVAEHMRPDHIDATLLSADLLESLKRYDLAAETYKKVPRDHTAFHAAELGRAGVLRAAGRLDAAAEVLDQLSQTHPGLPIVPTTQGDLARQREDYAGAVAAYDKALALYESEDRSQWFLYYARGISHERTEQWEKAEADFRKALELNPEHPQVLNYLGYSLVEKGEKLDEALGMIERAVAAQPQSGYIIDSLGWVLFRLGRYNQAVGHMERATELEAVDPIVNDHLGDVYWAVGRKLEAEFQWNRALSFDPEEKDAIRIRRKLEIGLDEVLVEEGEAPLTLADEDG